jgi:hypothetical protein
MSQIIYQQKGLALASGLKWPVLQISGKSPFKRRAAIRAAARDVRATRYLITEHDEAKYLGLYTPDELQRSVKGDIHSLAMVFLNALLDARSVDRSMLNAVLVMSIDGDHSKRALVIISDGHVVHDQVESAQRVHELVGELRNRLADALQAFSSEKDIPGAREVSWELLAGYANKSSRTQAVPKSILIPLVAATVIVVGGAGFAHHQFVTLPQLKAEALRKAAASDRTGEYLRELQQALQSVGWNREHLIADLSAMRVQPFFAAGWALKAVSCSVEARACTEDWDRVGGSLANLVVVRSDLQYQPQDALKDSQATFMRELAVQPAELTADRLPEHGNADADRMLRPVVNELVNAGVRVQMSEAVAWPPVPMQGVKPSVVIKRRQVSITADFHLIEESVRKMPEHFVPHSYTLSTSSSPMSVTVVGHAYIK